MNLPIRNIILIVLMLASAGLSIAMRPTHKIADQGQKIDLASMIPVAMEGWHEEKLPSIQVVDPQQKAFLDTIYSQVLSRTYVNEQGYRIMLSIAYGSDQSDSMKVHKPEVCYAAQGFQVEDHRMDNLILGQGSLPIKRVLALQGNRIEPITYWVTVADKVVRPDITQKLVQVAYGLSGEVPDGMLIRVSSIDRDQNNAFKKQDEFAKTLLSSLTPESRQRLSGGLK